VALRLIDNLASIIDHRPSHLTEMILVVLDFVRGLEVAQIRPSPLISLKLLKARVLGEQRKPSSVHRQPNYLIEDEALASNFQDT